MRMKRVYRESIKKMEEVVNRCCEKLMLVNELRADTIWNAVVKEYIPVERTILSEALIEYYLYGKLTEDKSTDTFRMKMGYILSEYCCMSRLSDAVGEYCFIEEILHELSWFEDIKRDEDSLKKKTGG